MKTFKHEDFSGGESKKTSTRHSSNSSEQDASVFMFLVATFLVYEDTLLNFNGDSSTTLFLECSGWSESWSDLIISLFWCTSSCKERQERKGKKMETRKIRVKTTENKHYAEEKKKIVKKHCHLNHKATRIERIIRVLLTCEKVQTCKATEISSCIKEIFLRNLIKSLAKLPNFFWVSIGYRQKAGNSPNRL